MAKNSNKILVLTDAMPWGHRAIAKAIFNYLKAHEDQYDYQVELGEIKVETVMFNDLYTLAYRYAPKATRVFHKRSGSRIGNAILKDLSKLNMPSLEEKIREIRPDLVISTYFIHTHSLAMLRNEKGYGYKLWSVVHDPWTITPINLLKEADLNIVYDEVSFQEGLNWGIEPEKMLITGWWTREEMYAECDREAVRRKLGFEDDRPVIFIGGGSLGTNSLTTLLPVIMSLKTRCGFIINTGTDKMAYNLVEGFARSLRNSRKKDRIIIKNMGWIDNMAEILPACDIVFGKAGPNFLFDVVAAKKPIVVITHMGGQEDGNIDLIKEKKIGWIKEKKTEITKFLREYLQEPKKYEEMYLENIERERESNMRSLPTLLERILSELHCNSDG